MLHFSLDYAYESNTQYLLALLFCSLATAAIYCQDKSSAPQDRASKPDLVVILQHPMDGTIRVDNIGSAPAQATKMILDCVRVQSRTKMYSCPNLPVSQMQTYFDPAFPNNATVQVPTLAPGASFTHKLAFWPDMKWSAGTYKFTATADAGHVLDDANPRNNVAESTLTIR